MKIRPWLLAALGLTAFGLLVWFAGPLVSIRGSTPLASADTRLVLIAAFALQYLLNKGWIAWQARRRNERIVDQLAPAPHDAEPPDMAQLRKRFAAALATLRHARLGSPAGSWSSLSWKFGRQYLYQLPWYVIIGAPGAGKTTALLNSGLQFPLSGQFGRGSVRGVGGTRNCDWWFTDRAVLLDTAGRYTTHEADRVADRRAWEGFLALLKRGRPRRPLNGALVAVSIADLLLFDPTQRAEHAATLRARLDEIRTAIGIRLPVYLLLTKCDLLPGFLDSFLAFDNRARDQVWGTTFDIHVSQAGRAAEDFPAAFEQLVQRLRHGLVGRMQAERDPQRRARIFAFPPHFANLKVPLNDLVVRAFGRRSASKTDAAFLRGVYFTSGMQEGTPIDRALSALGRELGLEGQILPPNQSTGKSFFLAGLLRDVVFPEAEISGTSPDLQRWRARGIAALLVAVQCAGALVAATWVTSYLRSSAEIREVAGNVGAARARIALADVRPDSDPRPLLPALNALQDLAASTSPAADEHAPLDLFRQHQRLKLAAAAHQAYDRMLLRGLLTRIVQRCEEQMRSGADLNLQYEALKAYRMLHETAHFDAASLKQFVKFEWDTALEPPLDSGDRARLAQHLDALLEAGAVGGAAAADPKLIESVRSRLAAQALSQRIATRVEAALSARSYPEFSLASLGAAASSLFVARDGHSAPQAVPGQYTLQAYQDGVRAFPGVASDLAREASWVLAVSSPAAGGAREEPGVRSAGADALAKYLNDYARAWTDFVDELHLKRAGNAAHQAQALAARDGPLVAVLDAVVHQTSLRGELAVGAASDTIEAPERIVEDGFARLRALMQKDAGGRRPLDAALADFNELQALRALLGSNAGGSDQATTLRERLEHLRADAKRFPEPVQSMLLTLAAAPISAPTAAVAPAKPVANPGRVPQTDDQLASACELAVLGRFPFSRESPRDISMPEFNRLFAPSGAFDSASGLDEASMARLRSAARIRDAFFASHRQEAGLRLTFRPHDMDETIDRFLLEVDGQSVRYAHGPLSPTVITWPGPKHEARVDITPPAPDQPALEFRGTWALFRLLDQVPVESIAPGRFRVVFHVGGRRASFDVESESGVNPFRMPELERFDCPSASSDLSRR
jgi:type VI secretion system protein ImpL